MKLGFIGTGKIASSVITGICNSKIKFKQIIISPRNKTIANSLKRKFNKVTIAKNNQEIIDKSNWIFSVSYTHLRAHETDSYLVCRLLLEKKHDDTR